MYTYKIKYDIIIQLRIDNSHRSNIIIIYQLVLRGNKIYFVMKFSDIRNNISKNSVSKLSVIKFKVISISRH